MKLRCMVEYAPARPHPGAPLRARRRLGPGAGSRPGSRDRVPAQEHQGPRGSQVDRQPPGGERGQDAA